MLPKNASWRFPQISHIGIVIVRKSRQVFIRDSRIYFLLFTFLKISSICNFFKVKISLQTNKNSKKFCEIENKDIWGQSICLGA
jgi:hypothetical protein